MPSPGQVNNPAGENSFDHFAPEPAYGEGTRQAALKAGAPLAGGKVAAGSLNAARRSQRQAVSGNKRPSAAPAQEPVAAAPEQNVAPATPADLWAAIVATPGAEQYPVLQEMAARARG